MDTVNEDALVASDEEKNGSDGADFSGVEYAEAGSEEEFLILKAAWERGELAEEDLPVGAVSKDSRGRTLVFGRYKPKIGRDADMGIKRMPADVGTVSPAFKPTVAKPLPAIRCVNIKKDGMRCNRWSIRGATVCLVHGGRLPTVKNDAAAAVERARMRIVDLTDDAVDVLEDLTQPGTADAIRLKAATEILDRAGIKGGMDINVEVEHKIDPALTIAERLKQINSRASDDDSEEIVDAEVVEEG